MNFRLPKAVSKSMAMEINLTGIPIDAQTALQHGLVSKVFPVETVVNEAVKTADVISGNTLLSYLNLTQCLAFSIYH